MSSLNDYAITWLSQLSTGQFFYVLLAGQVLTALFVGEVVRWVRGGRTSRRGRR